MSLKPIACAILLAFPLAVTAAPKYPDCTVKVAKTASKADKQKLAKLTKAEAESKAMAAVKDGKAASVNSSTLEHEDGCLIWEVDVKLADKPGQQEVRLDAGDGKVLAQKYEGRLKTAAENVGTKTKEVTAKAVDKTKETTREVKDATREAVGKPKNPTDK
jgi:hypothetical protein